MTDQDSWIPSVICRMESNHFIETRFLILILLLEVFGVVCDS